MPHALTAPAPRRVMLTADAVGGVLTQVGDLARRLAADGTAVDVVLTGPPAPRAARAARAALEAVPGVDVVETGLPLEWMADGPGPVLEAGPQLAALARERRADVVHAANPALLASGHFPCPVVTTLHSCMATWWRAVKPGETPPPELFWRTRLVSRGLRRADAAIAPSAPFAVAARAVYPDIRFDVVPNGRDPAPAPPALRRRGAFTAGRLWDEGKNVAVLDAAAAQLPFPVVAAGPTEGPNGARVALAHVEATGPLAPEAVAGRLAGAAVFVSTALYEPFGLAVLEAAQAGAALVLSDIPTFRALWSGAAVLVDPRDPEAVAAALVRVHEAPALRLQLAEAAQRRAARLTAGRMAAATMEIYRAAVGARGFEGAA